MSSLVSCDNFSHFCKIRGNIFGKVWDIINYAVFELTKKNIFKGVVLNALYRYHFKEEYIQTLLCMTRANPEALLHQPYATDKKSLQILSEANQFHCHFVNSVHCIYTHPVN